MDQTQTLQLDTLAYRAKYAKTQADYRKAVAALLDAIKRALA